MNMQHDTSEDKNFDDLAHHFKNKVYQGLKGQIRLAVLERDLRPHLNDIKTIIDAGGGQGQFALPLAKEGHHVSLCDISQEMLKLAQNTAYEQGIKNINFLHCSLQQLDKYLKEPVDILLCHAVLEWMAKPAEAVAYLNKNLKPGGILSLAFFNINSIVYKNLLRGNFRKVESGNFIGHSGSLTPINPLHIDDVLVWCKNNELDIISQSGIRVFHDYIANPRMREHAPEALLEMELKFSQQDPFRSLGRYIHLVARKRK
ncbi:methyltransferase domain-containing protein [Agarilytica rhodophyticola]|uniref:methyltransferase domain-containing protein n=1 Tax=Agarilytica rhodophyticola TaxID=1737490 RepID=UPI000B345DE6|nr:methyltransferase domain-containing protein [Agarilytica rhodophyticola]